MPTTDVDQQHVVRLLIRDLRATVGVGHDDVAASNAIRLRQFIEDLANYIQKVVDDTQQDIHDEFIDTLWRGAPDTRIRCGIGTVSGGASRPECPWRVLESWARRALPDR